MSDSLHEVGLDVTTTIARRLSPSEGLTNTVSFVVKTINEEIFVNQTTGHQTCRSNQVLRPFFINLRSSSPDDIRTLLYDRFVNYPWCWLSDHLASEISAAAIDLGFGYNGFILTMVVTVTYQTVTVTSNDEESLRMIPQGRMTAEESKSLKMEPESCSICLENLIGSKPNEITRMTCSHVFHRDCIFEWLKRKNTCPLCRIVHYKSTRNMSFSKIRYQVYHSIKLASWNKCFFFSSFFYPYLFCDAIYSSV